MSSSPTGPRVRAPEIPPRLRWLNTDTPMSLAVLRGRWVILDFWTFCCLNCLHVLDELRAVEAEHPGVLTVVGVHSPKFAHEADPHAVTAAVDRYSVHHPVVNDPDLHLWRQYAVKAWPTLVLVDPEGYVVAQAAGEGQARALAAVIEARTDHYEQRGTLRCGPTAGVTEAARRDGLHFPAKAVVLPRERTGRKADTLLVADAGSHCLVEQSLAGEPVRWVGSGERGRADGPAPSFAEPSGLALLPPGVADFDVAVADTVNHVLRGVRLSDGAVVRTLDLPAALAGVEREPGSIPPVLSPWDVVWWPAIGRLVVAAAGVHLLLSVDPADGAAGVLAGTTVEGLRDGPAGQAWLAQPSGLAVDGERLWFVDAETSALRWLDTEGSVHTAVGEGLFDFGHVDGTPDVARMQHPLGVALHDGGVLVADTYNGVLRRWDGVRLCTVATGLAEPSGIVVHDGEVIVVESAAHRLSRPTLDEVPVDGEALRTRRPATDIAPGRVDLVVSFTPAPGRKLDARYGPATRLTVSATPAEALAQGAGEGVELSRSLRLVSDCVLHVAAQAASCDDAAAEFPACYLARQDWGVPVRLRAGGPNTLDLPLLG